MSLHRLSRPVRRLGLTLRRRSKACVASFARRTEGVAAVEFALIVPIMLLMMIGSIEMSEAITVDRRVSQVASATGDLVARVESDIYDQFVAGTVPDRSVAMNDMMQVSKLILRPFDETAVTITMRLVTQCLTTSSTCAGQQREKWNCTYNGSTNSTACTCPDTAPANPVPVNLITPGDSVVVSEVNYAYRPYAYELFSFTFMGKANPAAAGVYNLQERLHLKTRGACAKLTIGANPACGCS